jgi:hypothetical protein
MGHNVTQRVVVAELVDLLVGMDLLTLVVVVGHSFLLATYHQQAMAVQE